MLGVLASFITFGDYGSEFQAISPIKQELFYRLIGDMS